MAAVELSIPSRPVYVGIARLALALVARNAGLDEETVDDIKIAVSEACTNAFQNAEEAGVDEPVQIVWIEESDRFVIEISDRGNEFSLEAADPADTQAARAAMSAALLASLVDDFELVPRDGGGMRARLVVRRR